MSLTRAQQHNNWRREIGLKWPNRTLLNAPIGKIDEFDHEKEHWTAYQERMELFFQANAVANGRKLAVFLKLIGPKTYGLLRNLVAPEKPAGKTLQVLERELSAYYAPKSLAIAERFKFLGRRQQANEAVLEFMAQLRKMAEHCDFGATLGESLQDSFVRGLRSETAQKKLLLKRI